MTTLIVDYESGNLHSVAKSFERMAAEGNSGSVIVSSDPADMARASRIVLPGVGAFADCRAGLAAREGLFEAMAQRVLNDGLPFLGICVGMQMLFTGSDEDPAAAGLDIIPGTVTWIPPGPKIPQMQWNRLAIERPDPMLANLGDDPWVYFVHSLHGVPDDPDVVAATVQYGTTLNAAFRLDNVFAAQFHPEKSSRPGLALLSNFVQICADGTDRESEVVA